MGVVATVRAQREPAQPVAEDHHWPEPAAIPSAAELSPRELEIARLVAKGYPNKTVAAVLEISPWTVAAHLRRIYAKLAVRCRAAMVARLMSNRTV